MSRITNPKDNPTPPRASAANGKHILLAEDDPFISRMYMTKLTSAGYQIELVNNGRDAYDRIKSQNPDLVMLDINMPELTGFEVVKALQADGASQLLHKIIILTNSANPADRKLANSLGIDYVVKADLTPHDVLDQINKKLGIAAS
jgi:CheY-like chemotaxis protein